MRDYLTARELYLKTPEKSYPLEDPQGILVGFFYNHIPELPWDVINSQANIKPSKRVTIKIYKEFYFDSRRFWRLASVWLDQQPVMIIQNAGREGDDFSERYITDKTLYEHLIYHLHCLYKPVISDTPDNTINLDDKVPISFYGNHLDGVFDKL